MLRAVFSKVQRVPLLTSLAASFMLGIIFWGAFNTAIELSNTETFCISCHEMRQYIFQDFKTTVHFSNVAGIRASCPDCHVPRTWAYKVLRKIEATNELFHHFMGSISTKEKFKEKRMQLAEKVWRTMERTDSRECRNCHAEGFMDLDKQRDVVRNQHLMANDQGKTCIDCHKGIAHKLPEKFLNQEHDRFEREGVPCWTCHREMQHPAADDGWDEQDQ